MPFEASVLLPVFEVLACLKVSVVIAIVVVTPLPFTKTIVVPIGSATDPLAGIVTVCPVVVIYKCFPASAAVIAYAPVIAFPEFPLGIPIYPEAAEAAVTVPSAGNTVVLIVEDPIVIPVTVEGNTDAAVGFVEVIVGEGPLNVIVPEAIT